jgi:methyltransferase (TIGR00027 family)
MKASRSSKTAAQMALSRAIESRKPSGERICFDPFAERFLDLGYKMFLFTRPLRDSVEKLIEARFAGHHHYVLARTQYFDDFLNEQLTPEVRQLVILGAGYDSRPYRFIDRLREVSVFEVDHPATTKVKQGKIEALLGAVPPRVSFVPVDFNHDRLGERLARSGYRPDQRTMFLWEGTTPYISAEAVDETLRFIASSSAPRSVLIFDYILKAELDGTCELRGARTELERMKHTTEPFVFGIDADKVESFMTARGFRDIHDVGSAELKTRYFRTDRQDAYVKPWWRIVHASVS